MAQEKGLGEDCGAGAIWDGPGNFPKEKSHSHGILLIAQYSLLLGWISGRSNQVIRGKNFAIISTARECFQILPRLFWGDPPYFFSQKFIQGHSHCRSHLMDSCQVRFCNFIRYKQSFALHAIPPFDNSFRYSLSDTTLTRLHPHMCMKGWKIKRNIPVLGLKPTASLCIAYKKLRGASFQLSQ